MMKKNVKVNLNAKRKIPNGKVYGNDAVMHWKKTDLDKLEQ